MVEFHNAELFTPVALYGQPLLQTAFGAVGGFVGGLIWRPISLPGDAVGGRLPRRGLRLCPAAPARFWRLPSGRLAAAGRHGECIVRS